MSPIRYHLVIDSSNLSGNQSDVKARLVLLNTTATEQDQPEPYDSKGAMRFIVATLLVYSLMGIVGLLILRIKRSAKYRLTRKSGSHREESLQKYIKLADELRIAGIRDRLKRETQRVTFYLQNLETPVSSPDVQPPLFRNQETDTLLTPPVVCSAHAPTVPPAFMFNQGSLTSELEHMPVTRISSDLSQVPQTSPSIAMGINRGLSPTIYTDPLSPAASSVLSVDNTSQLLPCIAEEHGHAQVADEKRHVITGQEESVSSAKTADIAVSSDVDFERQVSADQSPMKPQPASSTTSHVLPHRSTIPISTSSPALVSSTADHIAESSTNKPVSTTSKYENSLV